MMLIKIKADDKTERPLAFKIARFTPLSGTMAKFPSDISAPRTAPLGPQLLVEGQRIQLIKPQSDQGSMIQADWIRRWRELQWHLDKRDTGIGIVFREPADSSLVALQPSSLIPADGAPSSSRSRKKCGLIQDFTRFYRESLPWVWFFVGLWISIGCIYTVVLG